MVKIMAWVELDEAWGTWDVRGAHRARGVRGTRACTRLSRVGAGLVCGRARGSPELVWALRAGLTRVGC